MRRRPSSTQSTDNAIDKYLGTNIDKVNTVADGIEAVKTVADDIEAVKTVVDDIEAVKTVVENLTAVLGADDAAAAAEAWAIGTAPGGVGTKSAREWAESIPVIQGPAGEIAGIKVEIDGTSGAIVVNDAGADVDFRVESDTNPNALFVDGASGNVGIGTAAPESKFDVYDANVSILKARVGAGGSGVASVRMKYGTSEQGFYVGPTNALVAYDYGAGVERLRIDSSGNLGLGVVPSAWGSLSKAVQVGERSSLTNSNTISTILSHNWFSNTSNADTYIATDYASVLRLGGGTGGFQFFTAPSGTAGQPITFTQAMTLDANGRLGLGTNTPVVPLQIVAPGSAGIDSTFLWLRTNNGIGSTGTVLRFTNNTSTAGTAGSADIVGKRDASGDGCSLIFKTNGPSGNDLTERLRIDSSGNLGLGVTPSAWLSTVRAIQLGTGGSISNWTGSSGSLGIGANFYYDGSGAARYINTAAAALFDVNTGSFSWFTAPSGTADQPITFTQAMTLDASGNLLVGTTNTNSNAGAGVKIYPGTDGNLAIVGATSTSANSAYSLYSTGAGAFRFYVGYNGTIFATSTSITAISDASLKENIRDLETGLDEVMALRPRRFDWKNGDGQNVAGFVAQEVETVLPDLVYDYKYTADETKRGLKMGDMLPTAIKAIQELKALVDAQAGTIAALEARLAAANL